MQFSIRIPGHKVNPAANGAQVLCLLRFHTIVAQLRARRVLGHCFASLDLSLLPIIPTSSDIYFEMISSENRNRDEETVLCNKLNKLDNQVEVSLLR